MSGGKGRGTTATPQGNVQLTARFNQKLAKSLVQMGLETRTVYPSRAADTLDILTGEICYIPKGNGNGGASGVKSVLNVLSSFNGQGAVAASMFQDNPELQTEAILNSIRFVGTAYDNVRFSTLNGAQNQFLGVQGPGVHTRIAKHDMTPATFAEYYLPTTIELSKSSRILEPDVPPGKVTAELRPYNIQLAADSILLHIREVIYDTRKWEQAMNTQYRSTLAWLSMADGFFNFAKLAGILFVNEFAEELIVSSWRDGFVLASAGAEPTAAEIQTFKTSGTKEKRLLTLASKIGVLDSSVDLGTQLDDRVNDTLTDENVEEKKRSFLASIFYDGRISEFAFGYQSDQLVRGVDDLTGKLQVATPFGNMLHKQLNIPRIFVSSVVAAVRQRQERLVGPITKGANAGTEFDWLS